MIYFIIYNIFQSVDSPLSRSQLDELICMLDKDGDGEIDLTLYFYIKNIIYYTNTIII